MKHYSKEDLQEIISRDYGFQKELIENTEVCGLWFVRFEVNGIKYSGSTPYHGAKPRLFVDGYTAEHFWHGSPITEEYYEEFIKDKKIMIQHCIDPEAGDWESLNVLFDTAEAAEEYISQLEHPEQYSYDIYDDPDSYRIDQISDEMIYEVVSVQDFDLEM